MNRPPLVSIVTPVYNAAKYLPMAYESILRQHDDNWEWVVVDDGSTDNSGRLLADWAESDRRIRLFTQPNSGSAKMPRDRAVYESRGEYVAFLDADDTWGDDYLRTLRARQAQTDADIVYPRMLFTGEAEGTEALTLPDASIDTARVYRGRDLVAATIPAWRIGGAGGLYRRSAWTNLCYPQPNGAIWINSDEVDERLYLLNARRVAFGNATYHYRRHGESITMRVGPRRFQTLHTNTELLLLMQREFGADSNEYRSMQLKAFCEWRSNLRLFVAHSPRLRGSEGEIVGALADAFRHIRPQLLPDDLRRRFRHGWHFRLLFLVFALKYRPAFLADTLPRLIFRRSGAPGEAPPRSAPASRP